MKRNDINITSEEVINLYNKLPLKFMKNIEHNKEVAENIIKRLKENPKLSLYDYQLTDIVRHILIKIEELESKIK